MLIVLSWMALGGGELEVEEEQVAMGGTAFVNARVLARPDGTALLYRPVSSDTVRVELLDEDLDPVWSMSLRQGSVLSHTPGQDTREAVRGTVWADLRELDGDFRLIEGSNVGARATDLDGRTGVANAHALRIDMPFGTTARVVPDPARAAPTLVTVGQYGALNAWFYGDRARLREQVPLGIMPRRGTGAAIDTGGALIVADVPERGRLRVRRVSPDGTVDTSERVLGGDPRDPWVATAPGGAVWIVLEDRRHRGLRRVFTPWAASPFSAVHTVRLDPDRQLHAHVHPRKGPEGQREWPARGLRVHGARGLAGEGVVVLLQSDWPRPGTDAPQLARGGDGTLLGVSADGELAWSAPLPESDAVDKALGKIHLCGRRGLAIAYYRAMVDGRRRVVVHPVSGTRRPPTWLAAGDPGRAGLEIPKLCDIAQDGTVVLGHSLQNRHNLLRRETDVGLRAFSLDP